MQNFNVEEPEAQNIDAVTIKTDPLPTERSRLIQDTDGSNFAQYQDPATSVRPIPGGIPRRRDGGEAEYESSDQPLGSEDAATRGAVAATTNTDIPLYTEVHKFKNSSVRSVQINAVLILMAAHLNLCYRTGSNMQM